MLRYRFQSMIAEYIMKSKIQAKIMSVTDKDTMYTMLHKGLKLPKP
ncbi:MAG: hypothetical protein R6V04_08270 [bacterium]